MKKLFLTLFFAAAIFLIGSHGEMLWGNRLFLDEPRVHKIEKGEYLSKIAEQYYGDPQRWRELALINRAPNPNHIEVGEEILVPAANKVQEVRRAHTLTQVNTVVKAQQQLATNTPARQTAPTPSPAITTEPQEPLVETPEPVVIEPAAPKNELPWQWIIAGAAVLVLAIIGFMRYRRRRAEKAEVEIPARKREDSFEDFRRRRQYGESELTKGTRGIEDDAEKDQGNDQEESRRRRHTESVPLSA